MKTNNILKIAVIFLMVFMASGCHSQSDMDKEAKKVVAMLDENHDGKFGVKDGEYISATDSYEFTAYPLNDKTATFPVSTLGGGEMSTFDYDQASRKVTNLIFRKYFDAITHDWTGGGAISSIGGTVVSPDEHARIDDLTMSPDANILEVISHKKDTMKMNAGMGANMNLKLTPKNTLLLLTQVYKLAKYMDSKGFGAIHVKVTVFTVPKGLDMKQWNDVLHSGTRSYEELQKNYPEVLKYPGGVASINFADFTHNKVGIAKHTFPTIRGFKSPIDVATTMGVWIVDADNPSGFGGYYVDLDKTPLYKQVVELYNKNHADYKG